MAYTIEKCVPADADALARVHLATSLSAPRFKVTYGACIEDDLLSMWRQQNRESLSQQDPDVRQEKQYLKAVDSTNSEIAACAVWTFLPNGYNYLEDSELFHKDTSYPRGVNLTILEEFSDKIVGLRRKHIKEIKPLWCTYPYLNDALSSVLHGH